MFQKYMNNVTTKIELSKLSNEDILFLRASLDVEMKKRKIAFSVGDLGERMVIDHFKTTPNLPTLQLAPRGTKNVDALSRNGERYSIKTICSAKKTGTIYPDPENPDKQLFEYLLIVRLSESWRLKSIYQFDWDSFLKIRSWDKRMNAWYVSISGKTLNRAKLIFLTELDSDV